VSIIRLDFGFVEEVMPAPVLVNVTERRVEGKQS